MSLSAFVLVDAILLIGNHTISEYLHHNWSGQVINLAQERAVRNDPCQKAPIIPTSSGNRDAGSRLHIPALITDRTRRVFQQPPPAPRAAFTASARVTTARPDSTTCDCAGVTQRARPAAVVDASPGVGMICYPVASARWRSSPVRKSSPAGCAAAIPAGRSPAPNPRLRCLTGPAAASSAPITPSRPHNPVITGQARVRRQRPIRHADPRRRLERRTPSPWPLLEVVTRAAAVRPSCSMTTRTAEMAFSLNSPRPSGP